MDIDAKFENARLDEGLVERLMLQSETLDAGVRKVTRLPLRTRSSAKTPAM